MRKHLLQALTGGVALLIPLTLVASSAPASATATPRGSKSVSVVGYSIVAGAYSQLETAFKATPAGSGVSFNNSFGASTTQAKDVVAGQSADLVNFSTQPDMQLLVGAGLVSSGWKSTPVAKAEGGMVTDSLVSIVVRSGNPLKIAGWNNLVVKGIKIVTPDPISSGSARWNLLAAYESQLQQRRTPKQANAFINALIKHVVTEPSSGSRSLTTFLAGTGNVLLAYESDASAAIAAGKHVQIVQPAQNLLIENPAALTKSGAGNKSAAAFYRFIFSTEGQAIWASLRYRPTLPSIKVGTRHEFYQPKALTTIAKLGGWPAVTAKFFSPTGIITKAEAANGYTS
jgi:sulfate transport system substrate-binding protein